jgi:D-arabinose 1-dehydrogenase-like Zn-dependent alcohol dehydrogenase
MRKMQAAQIVRAHADFEFIERDIPEPGPAAVRIRVRACGICHSDSLSKEGTFPHVRYPIVPGHEVVGVIDALGSPLPPGAAWKVGDRVGVGWNGGYCGQCANCRRGDTWSCLTETRITGITYDGGYEQYMIAPVSALARVPDALSDTDAAPLMCAGITTFNALRHTHAGAGDLVAVHGIGGLGHLGVQFAAKMGFRTVAIARGADKGPLALQLGAHQYIDAQAVDPAAELRRLGGAQVILATVTNGEAMQSVIGGLGTNGSLLIVGAVPSLTVPALQLLGGRQSVRGWASGTAADAEDTLNFSALAGVRSLNEVFPFAEAPAAYARMMSGRARFRVVLELP